MAEDNKKKKFVVETKTCLAWMHDDQILIAENKPGVDVTLEDAIENNESSLKLKKPEKWALLVDLRQVNSMSKEARDYYAHESVLKGRCAIAILVESYFSKIIANFFIGFSKPPMPTKLFTSKEEAIIWLKKNLNDG